MLTSKQRAKLRGIANSYDTIIQIGKNSDEEKGLSENLIKQVSDALNAHELIKLRALNNSGYSAKEAANELSALTNSEAVQVIGTRFVLYKQQKDKAKRKIELE